MSFLWGSRPKIRQKSAYNPGQMDILNQLTQGLGQGGGGTNSLLGYLQGLLSGEGGDYENFEAPFMQNWKDVLRPEIEEHYAGQGALSSSGFGQALSQGSAGLQANLASLYSQSRSNAAQQIMQLLGTSLGAQPFAFVNKPGSAGFLPTMLASLAGNVGTSLGAIAGR